MMERVEFYYILEWSRDGEDFDFFNHTNWFKDDNFENASKSLDKYIDSNPVYGVFKIKEMTREYMPRDSYGVFGSSFGDCWSDWFLSSEYIADTGLRSTEDL